MIFSDLNPRRPRRHQALEMQPRMAQTRPLRIHNSEFTPVLSTALNFDYRAGTLRTAALGTGEFTAPVLLYQQTKVFRLDIRSLRATAGDAVVVTFNKVSPAGSLTIIATATTPAAAGFQTVSSALFNEVIEAGYAYFLEAEIISAASVNNAILLWAELQRTQPDVGSPY